MRSAMVLAVAAALGLTGCKATFGNAAGDDEPAVDAAVDAGAEDGPVDAPDEPVPCPPSPTQVQDPATGHCFTRFAELLTWNEAAEACAALGPRAHLATSTAPEENDAFSPLAGLDDVWIGGTDFLGEMQWRWLTLEPMDYENWRMGEPNDSNNEDCMVLEGDNGGLWDDRSCSSVFGYICERE